MSISVLIIGETGQLAQALGRTCPHDVKLHTLNRQSLDLTWQNPKIWQALSDYKTVDAIILAAAYTAVDLAEDHPTLALQVNEMATQSIAEFCKVNQILLIYYSTDYVFDGTQSHPYLPSDTTNPVNAYGKSKRAGEIAIETSQCHSLIFRTSWLYGGTGRNFLTAMLEFALVQNKKTLDVVNDQFGRPTFCTHLAEASWKAIRATLKDRSMTGTYHVSAQGEPISWAEFAKAIFDQAASFLPHGIAVNGIAAVSYPAKATRPYNSVLSNSLFEQTFNFDLPDWTIGLNLALQDWRTQNLQEIL